ncbi:MAG: T9SS type A sorting domain-containing protein [bacterium]
MKKLILLIVLIYTPYILYSQSVVFLHHSTGGNVFAEGKVQNWFTNYNQTNGKSYQITERGYPDSPYPWENYPYDFWNLWVNNACNSAQPGIECLNTLAEKYDVIILKHCFPGAGIEADNGTPDVTSKSKTLENYKAQYRALRQKFDEYPNTKFIVWTLASLHRLATNDAQTERAVQFVDWVRNDWLNEDQIAEDNVYVFDFWALTAEHSDNPANGKKNCLKYEYERSHSDGDSHPNTAANLVAGPAFAQFIVDVIEGKVNSVKDEGNTLSISPNPAGDFITVTLKPSEGFEPSEGSAISIYNTLGEIVIYVGTRHAVSVRINISDLPKGMYFLKVDGETAKFVKM